MNSNIFNNIELEKIQDLIDGVEPSGILEGRLTKERVILAGKITLGIAVLLTLLHVEYIINFFPLVRPVFTLVGLGATINFVLTRQRRQKALEAVKAVAERVL